MTKTNERKRSGCPSPETLSAFCDGEDLPSGIREHIASCGECQTAIREFEAIDRAIDSALASNIPPDIDQRILVRVRKALKEESAAGSGARLCSGFYLRIAALFAVLFIAGSFIWRDYSAKKHFRTPAQPRVMPSASVPAELSPRFGSIDVRDLDTVNFSSTPDPGEFSHAPSDPLSEAPEIPDHVKQTWVIPESASDLRRTFSVILLAAGIRADRVILTRSGNGVCTLKFPATKLQSIRFVRLCKRCGFSLLSSEQPQPEQNQFSGNADDPISYTAEFFPKK